MSDGTIEVGSVVVACPWCDEEVAIPVTARLYRDDEGVQRLSTDSDMADLWAHTWTHEGEK